MAAQMRSLIEKSAFSAGILRVEDCYAYSAELKEKGVRFILEPGPRDFGAVESIILDDSGNRLAIMSPIEEGGT